MELRYKFLGRSGLKVSEACLGTMTFGEEWGFGASKDECAKMFNAFTEAGGNFIDTANLYTNGTSERIVGELVKPERDRFVVATKYTLAQRSGDPNSAGNHRKSLVTALEASLRRLDTDYIDLYWVHAGDLCTPLDEVMRGLDDVVRAGKVLYIGISDMPAWQVAAANTMAELRGWSRCVALQVHYSLTERAVERELIPMARAFDLAVTPWGILGGGVLTNKYRKPDPAGPVAAEDSKRVTSNASRSTERHLAAGELVARIGCELGRSAAQVAIAWLRQRPAVTVLPILGARTVGQLSDNLAAFDLVLSAEQLAALDEATKIELGFPHDFVRAESIKKHVFSDAWPRIDFPRW